MQTHPGRSLCPRSARVLLAENSSRRPGDAPPCVAMPKVPKRVEQARKDRPSTGSAVRFSPRVLQLEHVFRCPDPHRGPAFRTVAKATTIRRLFPGLPGSIQAGFDGLTAAKSQYSHVAAGLSPSVTLARNRRGFVHCDAAGGAKRRNGSGRYSRHRGGVSFAPCRSSPAHDDSVAAHGILINGGRRHDATCAGLVGRHAAVEPAARAARSQSRAAMKDARGTSPLDPRWQSF